MTPFFNIVSRKAILVASLVVLLCSFSTTTISAFGVVVPFTKPPTQCRQKISKTELHAAKRRDFLSTVKGAIISAGGALASTIAWNKVGMPIAHAGEVSNETTGRIVTMEIANVNGQESETGTITIQLRPEWAPRGVQRFEELTESHFFDDCRIFRVLPGFIAQFGINGNPTVQAKWRSASIPDDPVKVSNSRGTVVFATAGPNTRTSQIFINTRQQGNAFLDRQGFSPFGEVIDGMDIVDKLYSDYGEGAPQGRGPNQGLIQAKGNEYLEKQYPKLSYISKARFAS